MTAILVAFSGGSVATLAQAAAARPICGPTTRIRTVAATPTVRVFADRARPDVLYVCRRGARTVFSLTTEPSDTRDGQSVDQIVGRFVDVHQRWDSGAPGDHGSYHDIVDTRTGRYVRAGASYQTLFSAEHRISPEGSVVWLAGDQIQTAPRVQVFALDSDGKPAALDTGTMSSDLHLDGRTVTWQQAGVTRQAVLAGPPPYRKRLRTVRFRRH
jgi:hypothetical protein